MTPLWEQATKLALAGIPVFPCRANEKVPATARGFRDATLDIDTITAWWTDNPNYNIAICPEDAGWCVIDLDPGGEEAWVKLLTEMGAHDATYEVETPRGGRHLYFRGSLPPSASKLAEHVDTRGARSYVLVPPSIVNGKPYKVLHDRPLIDVPGWIAPRIASGDRRASRSFAEYDTSAALARGRNLLRDMVRRGNVAISGCGGNDKTYALFAELFNLGLGRDTAIGLVLELWNPACQPPWHQEELETLAEHASQYAQNEAGAWNVGDAEGAFGKTEAFRDAMKENKPRVSRYRMMSYEDFDNEAEPKWIVPKLLPEDATVLWIGPSRHFKSFLLLDVFMGVSMGMPTFGEKPETGLCIYGAIEDLHNIGKARRRAWHVGHDVAGQPNPNFRACRVPFMGMPGDFPEWKAQMKEWLKDRRLTLLAIDTAGKMMGGLSEDKSENVHQFWELCDTIREEFGCTVIAVKHMSDKPGAPSSASGSYAWTAAFDSVIETRRPSMDQLAVEVMVRKHKNAPDGQRWTFRGHEIGGSLVFLPSTLSEHKATIDEADFFAPVKVGRVLAKAKAHARGAALTSPDVWHALDGELGDEKGVSALERLAKTKLRAYCTEEDGVLWWWYTPTSLEPAP